MFREMRRKEKEVTKEVAMQFLEEADEGVLSTISVDNGYPYSTAVNHVIIDNHLYFHCAKTGHKIDNIIKDNRVSFFAIKEAIIDQKGFTTKFKSVHIFGKAFIVEDKEEFKKALFKISEKYTGKFFAKAATEIASGISKTLVVRVEIVDIKGKSSIK